MIPKNQKIVVTGVAGFMGSHIAEALIPYNRVIGFDNLLFIGHSRAGR